MITTSMNWRGPACRIRSRLSVTAGSTPAIASARGLLCVRRCAIHEDVHVALHQPRSRQQDEHRYEEGGDGVRARVALVHEHEPDQHCDGSGEIAGEVKRVRRERCASVAARRPPEDDRAADVDRDHDPDHHERVPPGLDRGSARAGEMSDRPPGDEATGGNQDRRLGKSGEMLGLPVAVLVRDVRRTNRDTDREERQQGRHEVGARVQRLRDEAQAVRGEARAELERDEHDGRDHRDEGCPSLRIHPASETEEPAGEAGSSRLLVSPPELRAGDVALEVLFERRA